MSDKMRQISFRKMVNWMLEEYGQSKTIFGLPEEKFYRNSNDRHIRLFGERIDTPVGPAAGPNTQLAQNIVASYLTGSRFFELKTVQILDELEFPKPCIRAEDECYNTEWSTELSIESALTEYVKAWFLLHILQKEFFDINDRRFMFNMSVGYDLKGIQSPKVDSFIEGLKDASRTEVFQECKTVLLEEVNRFKNVDKDFIERISPNICSSITLSTLHGCPPTEIEAISRYLLSEKKLHTFVKMNPTLLGYAFVRNTFAQMGYGYIHLKEESFSHDLQYADGVAMLKRLLAFAEENNKQFGVKLSNTLPVRITKGELPGEEMYMSGRALYPLTINLAYKLALEFSGELKISFSGGADFFNIESIFTTGIRPVTLATTLLKPGGYMRFKQIAEQVEPHLDNSESGRIDLVKLKELAESVFADVNHLKEKRSTGSRKIKRSVPLTDCFLAPCTVGCPIGQDIPEYLHLTGEGRYKEAFEVIVEKNPLPFITGTICNHNCMTKCTRLDYDESVLIRDVKLEAAKNGYQTFMESVNGIPSNSLSKAKVAIIGAGPSGLAAGYFLAKAGVDVTIFDKREKAGGTVEYVIPDFRISREAIRSDVELIEKYGIKFEFGVNPELSVAGLKSKGFDYVYLAIGAGKSNPLKLEGETERVFGAIPFLEQFNQNKDAIDLGKNVAVIGGGNTAMDAARAALRVKDVANVTIIYRRSKEYMPADREELNLALEEGAVFWQLLSPVSLQNGLLKCQIMELGEPDESGRRSPVAKTGEYVEIPVDTVLTATGELVDYDLLRRNGIVVSQEGKIQVNPETLETNLAGVYIGGDALNGPATVVEGIAHGTKVAKSILVKVEKVLESHETKPLFNQVKQFAEIKEKKGILRASSGAAVEPERCLECSYICNICMEVCPNRANVGIVVQDGFRNHNQIIHMDGMCNECGNCATFCPYISAPYKDKLTLFWSEGDFKNSSNSGFWLRHDDEEPEFMVRTGERMMTLHYNAIGQPKEPIDEQIAALIWTAYKEYPYLFM